jgi:hypothetical protein
LPVLRHGISHAGAASAIATEQGFAFELAYGTLVPGWARVQKNRLEEVSPGCACAVIASEAMRSEGSQLLCNQVWRRRLIQNEGEVGPMQKLPQTLNTFVDATVLLMIIAFIATCSLAFGAQRLVGFPS